MENPKLQCLSCLAPLQGNQTKFCCLKCKNKVSNINNQSYFLQQARGELRKVNLINKRGGGCEICGYNKSLAALTFHHLDPKLKSFQMDVRALSNRKESVILAEFEKCQVLCSNCHMEIHYGADLQSGGGDR